MANKKISQLDPIGTIDVNQDSIPIVDYSEGVTKRTNLANIGQRVLEASTTTNLAEGTNLYFTNTRVYTKVKASLLAGSNTSITFDDALQTITIASQGNVQSVNTKTGAVVLTTTDISEGTNEYFTAARVRAVVLTGLSLATNAVISATDTVFTVADGTNLPGTPDWRLRLDNELCLVTGISGNDLTVTRGIEGTTPTAHLDGTSVYCVMTAGGLIQYISEH